MLFVLLQLLLPAILLLFQPIHLLVNWLKVVDYLIGLSLFSTFHSLTWHFQVVLFYFFISMSSEFSVFIVRKHLETFGNIGNRKNAVFIIILQFLMSINHFWKILPHLQNFFMMSTLFAFFGIKNSCFQTLNVFLF